jgi:RNA polymerase sigma factor (sigma-70 family)
MSARYAKPLQLAPPYAKPHADAPPLKSAPSPPGTKTAGQPTIPEDRSNPVQAFSPRELPEHPQHSPYPTSQPAPHPPHQSAPSTSPATTGDTTTPPKVTDLLQRAAQGDPAAWEEILHRYTSLVIAKVRTFPLPDADAHDAVQTTWLRLAENLHRIQHPDRLAGWLATTAARECLHILHQAKRTQPLTDTVVDHTDDPAVNPEQRVIDAHPTQTLHTLIAKMPPRRRRLLRALFTDHPTSYAELSHATEIPLSSSNPTRNQTLHQLRHTLQHHQLPPPA